eukprot:SAG22_NODE_16721_length_319_cov_0.945455_1_plen_69_part_01
MHPPLTRFPFCCILDCTTKFIAAYNTGKPGGAFGYVFGLSLHAFGGKDLLLASTVSPAEVLVIDPKTGR